jgi:putative DNA primase/helicase
MSYDTEDLKQRVSIADIVGRRVALKKEGPEFKGLCPFHNEKTPSFTVNDEKKFFHCFGCGKNGDVFTFLELTEGMEFKEAVKTVAQMAGIEAGESEYQKKRPLREQPKSDATASTDGEYPVPIIPVPDDAPPLIGEDGRTVELYNPKRAGTGKQFTSFRPSLVHPYRDGEGHLIGYVIRVDIDGGKITPRVTYCEMEDGSHRWCLRQFHRPYPLYGLDRLAAKPGVPVIVTEGEKTADAADRLFPDFACVSWSGGSAGVDKSEFSALYKRDTIVVPDADCKAYPDDHPNAGAVAEWHHQPGYKAALAVQAAIQGIARGLVVVDPEDIIGETLADGWDIADAEQEGWTADQARTWLLDRFKIAKARGPLIPPPDEVPHEGDIPPDSEHDDDNGKASSPFDAPFEILGYSKSGNGGTIYHYLPVGSQLVIQLSSSAHKDLGMMQLAPLDYWENTYPSRNGVSWRLAANSLMRLAEKKGIFEAHERLRGRGAWLDNEKSVLHLGDRVVVDGKVYLPSEVDSRFIYEASGALDIQGVPALNNKDAHKLIDICMAVRWENPISARLLAGWCVIAPICGAMNWRPHIWITGSSGAGKTTVFKDIVSAMVGYIALKAVGKTTEAGIRNVLGCDARPVLFDEAEQEDEKSQIRIQEVLDLGRIASSDSGGRLYKGQMGGGFQSFEIRSCFCMSSVNTGLKHYADKSRMTVLVLAKNDPRDEEEKALAEAHYERLMHLISETMTPEYAAGMLARSLRNLATLRDNANTFTKAAATVLGTRRLGDQLGTMMAGAYLLHSENKISFEDAVEWLGNKDWSEHTAVLATSDEEKLLQEIMGYEVKVSVGNGTPMLKRNLGDLVDAARKIGYDFDDQERVPRDIAVQELRSFGIKATKENDGILISTTHPKLQKMLERTPWASNWRRPLLSLRGAMASPKNVRYGRFHCTPAVFIPIKDEEPDGEKADPGEGV